MTEIATLAGGCFWCTEAIFLMLNGVASVTSGYTGGMVADPTFEQVCTGTTGHAEAVRIEFDPSVISYEKLLRIFFHLHDPTTLNRQGNDVGTQYRSAVFYHTRQQKKASETVIAQLAEEQAFRDPIITEVTKFTRWYPAEEYHKNYYSRNTTQPYCQYVIDPKIRKLLDEYRKDVKQEFLG